MRSNPDFAREKVAALRDALLDPTPESIAACLPGLAEAAQHIGGSDRESLEALKRELVHVRHLIEHGERLNRGLARLLGEQIAAYTPAGGSAPITAASSISVEG